MSLSILTTYDNTINANLLRTKLEHEGIPCFLNNEHFTNLMPHYFNILGSGVQILVPTDQLERAKEIAKIDIGQLSCPNCGAANIKNDVEYPKNKMKLMLIALLLAMPIGNLLNRYQCLECGQKFKK